VNALSFDTLAYARRMEAVGFTRAQAEAMAEEQAKLIDERLATKADIELVRRDIESLRQSTKTEIESLRQSTKADIEPLRLIARVDLRKATTDILTWTIGALGLQTLVILGAIVTLAKVLLH
jgi:hypothetical protein